MWTKSQKNKGKMCVEFMYYRLPDSTKVLLEKEGDARFEDPVWEMFEKVLCKIKTPSIVASGGSRRVFEFNTSNIAVILV